MTTGFLPLKRSVRTFLGSVVIPEPPFQRRFTPLASAGMQYYDLNTPFVATGDFEIYSQFVSTASGVAVIVGSSGDNSNYLAFVNNNIELRIAGIDTLSVPEAAYIDGRLHTVRVVRVGSNVEMFLDGVSVDAGNNAGLFTVGFIGANNSPSNFFNGYLANVSLQTAGDNRLYKLDENFGETSVVKNSLATLGSDVVVNGGFDTDTGWIKGAGWSISGGKALKVGGGGSFLTATGFSVTANKTWLVTIVSDTVGVINVVVGGAFNTLRITTGSHDYVVTGGGGTNFALQGGSDYSIELIRLQQADSYGTAINIAESQLFTEVADGWEGVESLSVSLGATWQDNGNGNYEETVNFGSFLDLGGSAGSVYLFKYIDAVNTGTLRVRNGVVEYDIPTGSGSILVGSGNTIPQCVGSLASSLTPESLKEFLEVA